MPASMWRAVSAPPHRRARQILRGLKAVQDDAVRMADFTLTT
jgi:hypothetical protein